MKVCTNKPKLWKDLNATLELMYICILHMKVSVSSKEAFQFIVDISDSWEKPSDLQ